MRHQKKTVRLGRKAEHRKALLANQVCNLIEHQRIKTTLAKAKAVRPLAEKMVTLGKNGSIHARRTAFSTLRHKDAVKKLFAEIAPSSENRNGGYTRIVKLGRCLLVETQKPARDEDLAAGQRGCGVLVPRGRHRPDRREGSCGGIVDLGRRRPVPARASSNDENL